MPKSTRVAPPEYELRTEAVSHMVEAGKLLFAWLQADPRRTAELEPIERSLIAAAKGARTLKAFEARAEQLAMQEERAARAGRRPANAVRVAFRAPEVTTTPDPERVGRPLDRGVVRTVRG